MQTWWQKWKKPLVFVPFAVGAIGYLLAGEPFTNALYASFALYFTNPISDAYNGFIELARWTAPIAMVGAILEVLQKYSRALDLWICSHKNGSAAVYSDLDLQLAENDRIHFLYAGERFQKHCKTHLILFSSDEENLRFYKKHEQALSKRKVYIGLRELEQGLAKLPSDVTVFDINQAAARKLWEKIHLWNFGCTAPKIAIYGGGTLASTVLSVGLQLNLFDPAQKVEYTLIAENPTFHIRHPDFSTMNGDVIRYVSPAQEEAWACIREADYVIIAEQVSLETLQTIAVQTYRGELYCYAPEDGSACEQLAFHKPVPFGQNSELLTADTICGEALIQNARALHESYRRQNPDQTAPWETLSGFLKCSNISLADFSQVITQLPDTVSDKDAARLEHIRWCRFHFLNYWRKSELGTQKNTALRLHPDLISYDDLPEKERKKDMLLVAHARSENQLSYSP